MRELEARSGFGREAIRYYIREGVLPEPDRPHRNAAIYSEEHVARLRLIRELREQRNLPLRSVKAVLDEAHTRELIADPLPGIEHLLPALLDGETPQPVRTVAEVAAATGLEQAEIRELARAGVVTLQPNDTIDFRDGTVLATWAEARAEGFDRARGYGPAYLAAWVETLRPATRAAVEHFLAQFSADEPRLAAARGAKGVGLMNRLLAQLHTRLVLEALAARRPS